MSINQENLSAPIAVIIITLATTSICFPVAQKDCFAAASSQNDEAADPQSYYDTLADKCKKKESKNCCLASVRAMKAGNYLLVSQEGCPAGYQVNALRCIDTYRWCQPIENIFRNDQNKGAILTLHFSTGGSIFGSSFEVKISGSHITYKEIAQGGTKEIRKIERILLPAELDGIRKAIEDADLINLPPQDFTKEQIAPDQAYYRIFLSLDGKENTIRCGIPLSNTEPSTQCQKRIDKVRLKLNSLLGVNIY